MFDASEMWFGAEHDQTNWAVGLVEGQHSAHRLDEHEGCAFQSLTESEKLAVLKFLSRRNSWHRDFGAEDCML